MVLFCIFMSFFVTNSASQEVYQSCWHEKFKATIRKWFGFRYLWCSQILPLKHYALLSASRKMLKTALNFVSRSSIVFLRQFCGFLSGEEGLILCELLPSDKYKNSDKFLDWAVFHHLSKTNEEKGKRKEKKEQTLKLHTPTKQKSSFTIQVFLCQADAFQVSFKKARFHEVARFSFTFSFSSKFNNQFFRHAIKCSLAQDLLKYLIMLINHRSPKCPEVYTVNNPCSCYTDTCSKKLIQSEIIIQIKTLFSATFKNC